MAEGSGGPQPVDQLLRCHHNQLDLSVLHAHSQASNPLGPSFSYREEFQKLDAEVDGHPC